MKNGKNLLCLVLALMMALSLTPAFAETYTGTAKGFSDGDVTVTLTIENGAIVDAKAEGVNQTEGIGTKALEQLPVAMVAANSITVDTVASATITSNAVLAAAADALAKAGLKPEDLVAKEVAVEVELAQPTFENPDVIVIGAGSTGVNAAIAAADKGAKVYLIEKNDAVGGSIMFAGGTTSAAGAQMQIDAGKVDSPENFAADIVRMGGGTNVVELTQKHTEMAAAAVNWLDSLGADFGDRLPKMSGSYDAFNVEREYRVTGGGKAIMATIKPLLDAHVEAGNVSLLLKTEVADIIVEDGAVKGVILTDGREFRAPATILATGGYGHSEEMLKEYNYENVLTMAPSFVTGDGYRFALKAGAKLNNMDYCPSYPGGVPTGSFDVSTTVTVKGYSSVIWVNTDGVRMVNEFDALDSQRKAAYSDAPHNLMYMIVPQSARTTEESSLIGKDTDWAKFDKLLAEENCIYAGETVEELAGKIGIDAAALKATIEEYNKGVDAGVDAFGRAPESLVKIEGALYAVKTCPYVMLTKGGPLMTVNAEVTNEAGEVIPGLYQGGELAGGANLGGSANIGGLANTSTIVWGKIAGESAATYAQANK